MRQLTAGASSHVQLDYTSTGSRGNQKIKNFSEKARDPLDFLGEVGYNDDGLIENARQSIPPLPIVVRTRAAFLFAFGLVIL